MKHPIRRPRKRWLINPKTRIHESQKRHSRKRKSKDIRRELEEDESPNG